MYRKRYLQVLEAWKDFADKTSIGHMYFGDP